MNTHTARNAATKATPRIYVASLADYNAGRLLGRWIDADQPADVVREQIAEMIAESDEVVAEEWAIHDYENFGTLSLGQFADIDTVCEIATWAAEHGEVFYGLVAHFGGTSAVDEAKRYMTDGYAGEYDSLEEYAEQLIGDCYNLNELPDVIRNYIDYEAIARDMDLNGDVFTVESEGRVHVFHANV